MTSLEDPMRYVEDSESSQLWRHSPEYRALFGGSWTDKASLYLVIAAGLLAISAALAASEFSSRRDSPITAPIVSFTAFTAFCLLLKIGVQYSAARKAFYERVKYIKSRAVDEALTSAGKTLEISELFVLNRRQLDEYHILSVRQAAVAFRNSEVASIVAFIVLIAGALVALNQETDSTQYVAGGLAGLGASLSAFMSRTFYTTYRRTMEQLREYYHEPFRTSQALTIERMARNATDMDQALRARIVESMLIHFAKDVQTESEAPMRGRLRRAKGPATATAEPDT